MEWRKDERANKEEEEEEGEGKRRKGIGHVVGRARWKEGFANQRGQK